MQKAVSTKATFGLIHFYMAAMLAFGPAQGHAQVAVSPRETSGVVRLSLSCSARDQTRDIATGKMVGATGETKECSAAIIAPPGFAIVLYGQENSNVPKPKDGSATFRIGKPACYRGIGWSVNCPENWWDFLSSSRRHVAYGLAPPISCNTRSARLGKAPAMTGTVTLTYSLITEEEARRIHRLLARAPVTPVTPHPPCQRQ